MEHTRLDCGCLRRDACSWHKAAPKLLAALITIEHGLTDKSGDFLAVTDILAAQARAAIEEAKK